MAALNQITSEYIEGQRKVLQAGNLMDLSHEDQLKYIQICQYDKDKQSKGI